jgi:hypothetical protein
VDCTVSAWGAWGACDQSCNTGTTLRRRTVTGVAQFGGKECPVLQSAKPCNTHACAWAPNCHVKHVHCRVKTVNLHRSGAAHLSHVIQVTHEKHFMHIAANYHCKLGADETSCDCKCDKHPPCCAKANQLLANAMLLGNKYKSIASAQTCCNMCTNHPGCTGWEYTSEQVCALKGGTPQFVENPPPQSIVTWAGLPSPHSCAPFDGQGETSTAHIDVAMAAAASAAP